MTREEILLTTLKTGTTVFYFVSGVDNSIVPFLDEPAYVTFNGLGVPDTYKIYSSGQTELWTLNNSNGFLSNVLLSSVTTNYVTGYSSSDTFQKKLSVLERQAIQDRFYNNVVSTITGQTTLPSGFQTYVFFNEIAVNDMFANINLMRSFDTLDTLSIYNKPINTITQQEAQTGILFGKLQAIQNIKDEFGNNIKIPLKNVPIGIFNKTNEFPYPMSLDSNGDRFFMNIKESASPTDYFDLTAYTEDQKFLKSQTQYLTVPDKFKYITTTNENGEYVVYNAPIGSSVVVFEVDLFKQGLTKDEIILNNFPFPTTDESNIGEFPCYYYNQIPVDVVPTWGNSQTGYTEVNIDVNLDLRKWTTYIFAPATYGNEKLELSVAKNFKNTFKVKVLDMTSKKFVAKPVEVAQIVGDLDRNYGAQYLWFNEILGQRQQLEFAKFGCHVLKLPGNLYDPNGFRTDKDGNPTNKKGVWLAAYQFRTFINIDRCYRDTGAFKDDNNNFWSHFNVNYFPGAPNNSPTHSGVGTFPYEKPWSINYPEPYKIAKKPINRRFTYGNERTYQAPWIVEEPAYSDGDLVGNVVGTGLADEGGFGSQYFDLWFPNQIAFVATKNYMYKYEKGVSVKETFSNGYEPYWDQTNLGPYISKPIIAGISSVNNGEKYQRLECGYGYFMKYQDWPRTFRVSWGADIYFYPDTSSTPGYSSPGGYDSNNYQSLIGWTHNAYNIDDQNYAFAFNQFSNNRLNTGGIDIYRIVESGLDNILIPENFVIPTFVNLHIDGYANRCYSFQLKNNGVIPVNITNRFNDWVYLPHSNSVVYPGQNIYLEPGQEFVISPDAGGIGANSSPNNAVKFTHHTLPGNDNFDTNVNKYTQANYTLRVLITGPYANGSNFGNDGTAYALVNFVYGATSSSYPDVYIKSQNDADTSNLVDGITDSGFGNADNLIDVLYQ